MTHAESVERNLTAARAALTTVSGEMTKDQAIACGQVFTLMALAHAVLAVAERAS